MAKIYRLFITKGNDGQEYEQQIEEKVFKRKVKLKEYLNKEGYFKESKNQYMKITEASISVAEIHKVKIK
ncbi:hypothetical protein I6G82_07590 [Lysinibacillus macroides]|uniref:Uncharacterized protein n=1 Tax=Lysinibacillus macroides TaxID=33935 RepID=A0A0M9DMD2_9BACI|nr:hypothetical protein [Lysinibacillus macroides]KOY83573.1 hypothetical protein ADM90_10090 [Lysinibacillus macroides]QPR69449.1 hypothetical protein I6G82_07590 [Lysinibacillus macroides]